MHEFALNSVLHLSGFCCFSAAFLLNLNTHHTHAGNQAGTLLQHTLSISARVHAGSSTSVLWAALSPPSSNIDAVSAAD